MGCIFQTTDSSLNTDCTVNSTSLHLRYNPTYLLIFHRSVLQVSAHRLRPPLDLPVKLSYSYGSFTTRTVRHMYWTDVYCTVPPPRLLQMEFAAAWAAVQYRRILKLLMTYHYDWREQWYHISTFFSNRYHGTINQTLCWELKIKLDIG